MTASPPPPGRWGAQHGQPAHGQPAPGQPGQGPLPPGYPQRWYPPPGPPKTGSNTKWLIVAALGAVIAVAAAVIVIVLHSGSGGSTQGSSTSASASGIASANDTGPVTVITEDPSCAPWTPIINTLTESTQQNGWDKRDASIPASAWSPEQRTQYQAAGAAMLRAADQAVALAKLTPHRVMRELYEQSIAYWHAYSDSIANYTPIDDYLARVTTAAADAVGAICNAINYGSAAARGPLIPAAGHPTQPQLPSDPAKPARFLGTGNSICTDWVSDLSAYSAATTEWEKTDANIPASQWSPEQKALNDAVGPIMTTYADKFEQLGRRSANPTLEDFAVLSGQYTRAYVRGISSYVPSDQYLDSASSYSSGVVRAACQAVGS